MVVLSMKKNELFAVAEAIFYAGLIERTKTEINMYWSILIKFGKSLKSREAKKFVDEIMVQFAKRHPEVLSGVYKKKKTGVSK